MIPQAYITEWSNNVPWQTNEQVEQDLVICRALVEIFKDEFLASRLAFRGGTALHKLFLQPQPRYSEDIDLVQIKSEPIKETIQHLQKALSFLGKSNVTPRKDNNTIYYRFESEFPPIQRMKLKIEINCREHFSVLGWEKKPFSVDSEWFNDKCNLTTYSLEELLGTKLRALYQRRKGRDLFDLWKALTTSHVNPRLVVKCFKEYMSFSLDKAIPTKKQFLLNLEAKRTDAEFLGDTVALLRPDEKYILEEAFEDVINKLVEPM
ncbi:nucleotidyl transferase AbiEii/AbiGii toxin family protein [Aquiflexum sp.]|uniref:nucleotidyl transferase AbiEii/AbiGii toxin family protein n=1 Tax=Aquiflexum sp. TaxID=1872584 RepID=UPI003593E25F